MSGWESEFELAGVDRLAQAVLDCEALERLAKHMGAIDFERTRALGALDRRLGLAEQVLRVALGLLRQRAADRDLDADEIGGEPDRRLEGLADPLGDLQHLGKSMAHMREDSEFITADPRKNIPGPQHRFDPPRHCDDELVARHRTQRFVDAAEPDEIERDHRVMRLLLLAALIFELIFDLLDEADAVGQRGQAVGQQLLTQRRFGLSLAGAVGRGEQQE